MRKLITAILVSASLALGGCAGMRAEDQGALAGAAIGGAVGHNFGSGSGRVLATMGGALVGALAGSSIGRQLDAYDEQRAQRALEYNETGHASYWTNPDDGYRVAFTPTETYRRSSGQYCREYRTQVEVGYDVKSAYGTACRQPDGSWQIQ